MMYFERAKAFIYKNARPLEMARWKFLFENGSKEDVLTILATYQNDDGGFGHALEPDCWNPNSSPIQTWCATRIVHEIKLEDQKHPIIQGILRYLSSGKDFDGHTWLAVIKSNDDYPHAPWWTFESGKAISYNPTASLAGFIIKFADKNSDLYALGCRLAKEALDYFQSHYPVDVMHTVSCFVELYTDLKGSNTKDLLDLDEFRNLLHNQIKRIITNDKEKWGVEYVCKPSLFFDSITSDFYSKYKATAEYECDFIVKTQEKDGTWAITWSWGDYPEAWILSKQWWKSDLIIKNIKFIRAIRE